MALALGVSVARVMLQLPIAVRRIDIGCSDYAN